MYLKHCLFCLFSLALTFSCNPIKKSIQLHSAESLNNRLKQFIHCHNTRDHDCLLNLYHKDYQSLSPINKPQSISVFIKNNLNNLEKNNFEVVIQIKEIGSGNSQAYVSMDWQLKTKGTPKADDPFANVQRLDIWKKTTDKQWVLFRTIIYNERRF